MVVVFFVFVLFFSSPPSVNVFEQGACDARGQVLCLGPEYRAEYCTRTSLLPINKSRRECALAETPHTKKDYYQELLV